MAPLRPVEAARSGWMARWFGRNRRQPALDSQPPLHAGGDAPFTPETCPGLSPEACAFFNTPVEECDPDLLRLMLVVLARYIADSMPPELGMDAEALFSMLCGRLGTEPGEAGADAPPAEEPPPPSATLTDASPEPAIDAQGTAAAEDAATAASATTDPIAGTVAPAGYAIHRDPAPLERSRPFGRRRLPADRGGASVRRSLPDRPQAPPPRRLCYAACAGPP